ncbi:hypothetical protein FA95DRAFT_1599962 [Auriscalpium vulgare]|uniref:Uncharacterized protein n=1 Tax=Auriscalpium vulgare TaxID=40419 RepID=A0ACB8R4K5_9AGAM|nr:hypothetical protein FA95DRAFT_1599962 [Auriscalpium vulgare]
MSADTVNVSWTTWAPTDTARSRLNTESHTKTPNLPKPSKTAFKFDAVAADCEGRRSPMSLEIHPERAEDGGIVSSSHFPAGTFSQAAANEMPSDVPCADQSVLRVQHFDGANSLHSLFLSHQTLRQTPERLMPMPLSKHCALALNIPDFSRPHLIQFKAGFALFRVFPGIARDELVAPRTPINLAESTPRAAYTYKRQVVVPLVNAERLYILMCAYPMSVTGKRRRAVDEVRRLVVLHSMIFCCTSDARFAMIRAAEN